MSGDLNCSNVHQYVLRMSERWDRLIEYVHFTVSFAPLENDKLLDESIVETARRRREYPQAIVPYVVRTLKAERKLMVGPVH